MREIKIITTKKCGTKHKWKIFDPKIEFHFDGWEETVSLIYEDWCEECYVLRKRVELFSRET